jgi:hypothetical protein
MSTHRFIRLQRNYVKRKLPQKTVNIHSDDNIDMAPYASY